MSDSRQQTGITRRFRATQRGVSIDTDEFGFVDAPFSYEIEDVLRYSAVLIRGQPWTGKSYIAEQISKQRWQLELGRHVWTLLLQDHCSRQPLVGTDWDAWRDSKENACWIIDSIDEGELIEPNVSHAILDQIRSLNADGLSRLRVLLFVRADEVPDGLKDGLQEVFGDSFADLDLLPLDRNNAERYVGISRFPATLDAIKRFSLKSVAAYPAALAQIAAHANDEQLTDVEVWCGVLTELLRERRSSGARHQLPQSEIEHQFNAAARLAVVMTFSEIAQLSKEGSGQAGPCLADLINPDAAVDGISRDAARAVVRTAMFHNGRFAQRNIQEWMCAFGLASVGCARLKPLVVDSQGKQHGRYQRVLGLLHKTTEFDEVQAWLCERNGGVPPRTDTAMSWAEALATIDHLESLADTTQWNIDLWGERGLDRLAVPGIGVELAQRASDIKRSANRRELMLQIAIETCSTEVVETAVALVKNLREDEEIRRTALSCVLRLGSGKHIDQLADFVRRTHPTTRIQKSIVSTIITRCLENDVWTVEEAVKFAPVPEGEMVDSTALLVYKLKEQLTVRAARMLVKQRLPVLLKRRRAKVAKRSRGERRNGELFQVALKKLLQQEPPNEADLDMLIPLALLNAPQRYRLVGNVDLDAAWERSTSFRRKLYTAELQRNRRRKPENRRRQYWWILNPEDVEWLMERVIDMARTEENVWVDLIRISRGAPRSLKQRARRLVDQHRPGLVKESDRTLTNQRRRTERQRRKQEQQKREQEEKETGIADAVQEVLANTKLTPQQRMWQLSWICFAGDQERPRNVVGAWSDLLEDVKTQALDACRQALGECEPTEIPDGSTYPATIIDEARCFRHIVVEHGESFPLAGDLIKKWLPSVFVFSMDNEDAVFAACYRADPEAAEQVVYDAVCRDMRNESEHMYCASRLDEPYWRPELASRLLKVVREDGYAARSRAELLRVVAKQAPDVVSPMLYEIIGEWERTEIWYAALGELLHLDVETAWPYVVCAHKERGKDALLDLGTLYAGRRNRVGMDSPVWTPERLLELSRMLCKEFPPEKDPPREGWPGPEQELRDVRDNIPEILFRRGVGENRKALEQLVREQPKWKDWYDQACAQEKARGQLAGVVPLGSEGFRPLPFQKVCKLLENAEYRIIRDNDDLLDVLEELIRRIGRDAGKHIEMLYLPEEIADGSKRRHESALQSYIHCRLSDLLPRRVLDAGTQVSFNRESQTGYRQRTDIKVEGPRVHGDLATVIIEIKWSDNAEKNHNVSRALKTQLGEQYLLREQQTHGIFLVGWNGKLRGWKREAGRRPKPPSVATLEKALTLQAEEFRADHPELSVRAVVLDLEWPQS